MKKVVEVLLRTSLRRYPIPTRLSLFSYLGQYAWLKDVLEELRPELFPVPHEDKEITIAEMPSAKPSAAILGILDRSEVYGRVGRYQVKNYLGARGNGHLFGAIDLTSKRPVTVKEFLLSADRFTKTEALQRQSSFQQLASFQLADGRSQNFRVMQPIEAIADTETQELCFLITDQLDQSPSLRHYLKERGMLSPDQVREVLSQILQTLDFLHQQKFSFSNGSIQNGLVHGNLSLDSVLWTERASQFFVYLCDLRLWEQCFDPDALPGQSTQLTPDRLQQDLAAVGNIGISLLQGLDRDPTIEIEPQLAYVLNALQTAKFDSAETARQQLLKRLSPSPIEIAPLPTKTAQPTSSRQWSLLGLSLLALLMGAWAWRSQGRSVVPRSMASPPLSTCCLSEVSALPPGSFTYTAVKDGTWSSVLQQRNLLQRGQGLTDALALAQPKLQLRFAPAATLDDAMAQVRSGAVDFAVMPLLEDLPKDMMAQEIAYDGLAAVVAFSYAERQKGLPPALKGKLSLDQVRQLYQGQVDQWQAVKGPDLAVRRYVSNNPEAIAVFEQKILDSRKLQTFPSIQPKPTIHLSRQVIRDFEDKEIGSIGIAPLSEILGQCSVYPLALSLPGQAAVQPVVLSNGQDIDPETDLCTRKGAYAVAPDRFPLGNYPLSYPIVVVYPRDNRRSAMGKKFVELMRTMEGQQLLKAAGLVPLGKVKPPISTLPR
jgi:serine/threonine protein kinase